VDLELLTQDVRAGNHRALARAISLVESGGSQGKEVMKRLFASSGKAHLIGVTGSPGVGKSTLVDALITQVRKDDLNVAVLAIDPTSPFTGGAILGDRIRMQDHTLDQGVFIRSMANRGHSGGIAIATYDAARILASAGFDIVIIETVGVGQSELAIAQTADTTILVLMPGSGDDVQAIKSGIMEIGDIFVVNKADLPGADKCKAEIVSSLELVHHPKAWRPPVVLACAETKEGAEEIWRLTEKHKDFLLESGLLAERRREKIKAELSEIVAVTARDRFLSKMNTSAHMQKLLAEVIDLKIDTHSAAQELINDLLGAQSGSS
jgi:LAO/AO transport system kinase